MACQIRKAACIVFKLTLFYNIRNIIKSKLLAFHYYIRIITRKHANIYKEN